MATVMQLRVRRSRPGRVQTSPQAARTKYSTKSSVSSLRAASARSTCSSPSTRLRISMPRWNRSSVMPPPLIGLERQVDQRLCGARGSRDREVGAHALGVHLQSLQDFAHPGHSAPGQPEGL